MYKIINRHIYEIASGENITLCDIIADTSTDLPDTDDQALYKIAFGSFAYVIDEGVFYSLDSSGTWNGGSYSDVVDEVITARGSFSSLDARLDDMDVILNNAKLGVKYKGAVNYYNDLPATGNEIGDAYTVKYAGSSGTTPDGTEYVWGELGGVAQWIDFSKDCYTKSEINTMLAGKVDVEAGKGLSSNDFTDADRTALVELVDGGAKNLSNWDGGAAATDSSFVVQNEPITLKMATYVISFDTTANSGRCEIVFRDSNGTVGSYTFDNTSSSTLSAEITLTADAVKFNIFTTKATTITNFMICTKVAWDISHEYQPYRPSYQELYEMVKALQGNQ